MENRVDHPTSGRGAAEILKHLLQRFSDLRFRGARIDTNPRFPAPMPNDFAVFEECVRLREEPEKMWTEQFRRRPPRSASPPNVRLSQCLQKHAACCIGE